MQNVLRVEFSDFVPTYLVLSDINGKVIMRSELIVSNKAAIPVSMLESGVYFVSAYRNNTLVSSKQFVKE